MRTTINIDDELLDKASKLTGIKEKTSLVSLGLEALIARKVPGGLLSWGAPEKKLEMIPPQKSGRHIGMVLVDTSVWVVQLRNGNIGLETLLNEGHVVCHPFIVGELACGNLKNRAEILSLCRHSYGNPGRT